MLTANATLAIFVMLGISSLAVFGAKKAAIPHTVLLVIIGVMLGIIAQFPAFSFFREFTLTPELLFYLLLPTLIFESAYNINVRRIVEDTWIILLLSIVGLMVSAFSIAAGLYFSLGFLGMDVPFMLTLLFGTLISATDPVAVLSLFKEYGAPRRLSLIFEGESLFNDATAVAAFFILLEIINTGFNGFETILEGSLTFLTMLVGGVIFGILIGGVFAKLVGFARENEIASITLTIALAHITFILAEIISDKVVISGFPLHISPIISTTIAALLMGNYGRSKIHPKAEEFVEQLWGQLAFMSNSLIFLLIGIIFVSAPIFHLDMVVVVVTAILIVAFSRAISIYPIVSAFNIFVDQEKKISKSWQHLLAWGSLRGALAITMVLLIPDDIIFTNWNFYLSPKDFLLALTIGCISATLFIKATTIKGVMNKLKLNELTDIEKVEEYEAKALIHHEITNRIARYKQRGYIDHEVAETIALRHKNAYELACSNLSLPDNKTLSERVLRIFSIGIEKRHLKELYHHNEVNEEVFRRLTGKLQLQLECVEKGNLDPNMSTHLDGKDIFEIMAQYLRKKFNPIPEHEKIKNLYMYYRAQAIISRKVLKELSSIDKDCADHVFSKEAMVNVAELYSKFKDQSDKKKNEIAQTNPDLYKSISEQLASHGVHKIEEKIMHDLYERQLLTPKLYINLKEELL